MQVSRNGERRAAPYDIPPLRPPLGPIARSALRSGPPVRDRKWYLFMVKEPLAQVAFAPLRSEAWEA
jgi:hypothetical protein